MRYLTSLLYILATTTFSSIAQSHSPNWVKFFYEDFVPVPPELGTNITAIYAVPTGYWVEPQFSFNKRVVERSFAITNVSDLVATYKTLFSFLDVSIGYSEYGFGSYSKEMDPGEALVSEDGTYSCPEDLGTVPVSLSMHLAEYIASGCTGTVTEVVLSGEQEDDLYMQISASAIFNDVTNTATRSIVRKNLKRYHYPDIASGYSNVTDTLRYALGGIDCAMNTSSSFFAGYYASRNQHFSSEINPLVQWATETDFSMELSPAYTGSIDHVDEETLVNAWITNGIPMYTTIVEYGDYGVITNYYIVTNTLDAVAFDARDGSAMSYGITLTNLVAGEWYYGILPGSARNTGYRWTESTSGAFQGRGTRFMYDGVSEYSGESIVFQAANDVETLYFTKKYNIKDATHIEDVSLYRINPDRCAYSTKNPSLKEYQRSEDFFVQADMTCVSPWNSYSGVLRCGTLVTPRHAVCASHWSIPNGTVMHFVDNSGNTHEATVSRGTNLGKDLYIVEFADELPSSITPCKILPPDFYKWLPSFGGIPMLFLDRHDVAWIAVGSFITEIYGAGSFGINTDKSDVLDVDAFGLNLKYEGEDGDSGSPVFMFIGDDPALIGPFSSSAGPSIVISFMAGEIEDYTAPYRLDTVDLDGLGFRKFTGFDLIEQ